MSGYQWRGYGSSWNHRGGGGRFGSFTNYGKSAGKGNGKSTSLPSLLNQLQSEIAAQQQLQAIASVLTPVAGMNTPALSHQCAEPAPAQDASFKLLHDEIASLRAEMTKSQPPQATQIEADAAQLLSELRKEVLQRRSQDQPSQVSTKSEIQCHLAEQLQSMREELATMKAQQAVPPSSKRKRPSTPCAPNSAGDASNVTKVEHREFFSSVFGKRSVLCKVASMPLSEWAAVQAAKLSQSDFDSMVAKFEPQMEPEDEADEGVLKACFLLWKLDRGAASSVPARTPGA